MGLGTGEAELLVKASQISKEQIIKGSFARDIVPKENLMGEKIQSWPSLVNHECLEPYNYREGSTIIVEDNDVGSPKTRQRSTDVLKYHTFDMEFTLGEWEILKSFVRFNLRGGALTFEFPVPNTRQIGEMRLIVNEESGWFRSFRQYADTVKITVSMEEERVLPEKKELTSAVRLREGVEAELREMMRKAVEVEVEKEKGKWLDTAKEEVATEKTRLLGVATAEVATEKTRLLGVATTEVSAEKERLLTEARSEAATEKERLLTEAKGEVATEKERLLGVATEEVATEKTRLLGIATTEVAEEKERLLTEAKGEVATEKTRLLGIATSEVATEKTRLLGVATEEVATEKTRLLGVATTEVETERARLLGVAREEVATDKEWLLREARNDAEQEKDRLITETKGRLEREKEKLLREVRNVVEREKERLFTEAKAEVEAEKSRLREAKTEGDPEVEAPPIDIDENQTVYAYDGTPLTLRQYRELIRNPNATPPPFTPKPEAKPPIEPEANPPTEPTSTADTKPDEEQR